MRLALLLIAGIIVLGFVGFGHLIRNLQQGVERQYAQAAEEPMVDMAHLFAALIESRLDDGLIDPGILRDTFSGAYRHEFEAKIYDLRKTQLFTHLFVTDRSGLVLFDSEGGQREGMDYSDSREIALTMRGDYGARSSRKDPEDSLSSVFYVAAPILHQGDIVGAVSVSRPERATMGRFVQETQGQLRAKAVRVGLLVTVIAAAWAYVLLRPIARINQHAMEVEQGARGPLPETGIAELRTLSRNLEKMRQSLEGKKYVEEYVQTLTHELKSPLAAIQGASELLQEDMPPEKRNRFAENIRAEAERASDLVRRMLQLTALESRSSLEERSELDLKSLVQGEIDRLKSVTEQRGIRWGLDLPTGPARLAGDPFALEIAVRNLLSNAIDFSPQDATISVQLAPEKEGWALRIEDEGTGIPDYAQERIFDRFYSLKHKVEGKKSSGLGLCFVREAAELHGGVVELENRPEQGVEARLWLPAVQEGKS